MSIMINGERRSLDRIGWLAFIIIMLAIQFLVVFDPEIEYKEVTVHHGDTLEAITLKNTDIPWRGDIRKLISKTREVNDADLGTIYPGQKLKIAVYKK